MYELSRPTNLASTVEVSRTLAGVGVPPLTVELVPETCWLSNVRSLMKKYAWTKVARMASEDAGGRCQVCGGRGRQHAVECHEEWIYDEVTRTQILARLTSLCPMCHHVKHFGRSVATGYGESVYRWLCRVNGWPAEQAERYIAAVGAQFAERSRLQWALDLRAMEGYDVTPEMLDLEGYVLAPEQRVQAQHRRQLSMEDVIEADAARRR